MESSGCGELSGTSIRRKPAWYKAAPMASTSWGCTPRRMATSGRDLKAASKGEQEVAFISILEHAGGARQVIQAGVSRVIEQQRWRCVEALHCKRIAL